MTVDYRMSAFSADGPLPLHVSRMTPAQSHRFGRLSAAWPGAILDPDGYIADDNLAREVLRELTDHQRVSAMLGIASTVPACEASRRMATAALALASAADLPQLIAETESLLGRIERDMTGE
ncbi:hypothetical protein BJD99_19110 [Rhodococcus sp. 1163]|uniref:hypothetical protein n=1 Tax=Rhodococcus sp. 1163 TaxID=1905289 RepID=UPI0009FD94F0|nr:hypothetical protein [Rhodococcus sp. 1163]ORI18853.1 hypothetical protein BJD99_19110 [Rhodococcus sp. 1163]